MINETTGRSWGIRPLFWIAPEPAVADRAKAGLSAGQERPPAGRSHAAMDLGMVLAPAAAFAWLLHGFGASAPAAAVVALLASGWVLVSFGDRGSGGSIFSLTVIAIAALFAVTRVSLVVPFGSPFGWLAAAIPALLVARLSR